MNLKGSKEGNNSINENDDIKCKYEFVKCYRY